MTGFSITPVGPFPEQTDEGFPQFIQFQADGTDLGGPDADTLNFGPTITATRGVGENENVVTIDVDLDAIGIMWQSLGVDLGTAQTVNLADGLTAELVDNLLTIRVTGSPPQTFIQWLQDGTPLGDDSVHYVNVVGPLLQAVRNSGVGPSEIVLTAVPPQWMDHGADRGDPYVIDVGDNLRATQQSGGVVRLDAIIPSASEFTFADVPGDHTIAAADFGNGLSTSGTTGSQHITVPDDSQLGSGDLNGKTVLIYQEGAAAVDVLPVSGVNVRVRSPLLSSSAGQYATLTLIHTRHANEWVLCGDLASA